jgi:selenide, water dikinase
MIDTAKRRKIMQRSIKLGHCICNPKQGCPCDLFKEKNICMCAGERPDDSPEDIKLTRHVENAGCASKINQNDLKIVLAGLPEFANPNVLVGTNTCDDAGVYKISDEMALVQSVDVFTPGVDDPYTFGQIAAANSLSDIYAMGGKPLTALTVIGFPIHELSHRVMNKILKGGMDKMDEASVAVIGGHSINDNEIKCGFAVTGTINPKKIITNSNAKVSDVLILTKPVGVGVISFAAQLGKASDKSMAMISESMTALNRTASEIMIEFGANAATDVTGFGLLGHMSELVSESGVTVELYSDRVPIFYEALEHVRRQIISGAIERNREYAEQYVAAEEDVSEEIQYLFYDPQTSGGLLISAPEEKAAAMLARLHKAGIEQAAIIGKVTGKSRGKIVIRTEDKNRIAPSLAVEAVDSCCDLQAETGQHPATCCDVGADAASSTDIFAGDMHGKFMEFMKSVNAPGALTITQKELIAVSLSILSQCGPCVKINIDKARSMKISDEEINEAVWMAISFGGAPTMMFYNKLKESQ